MAWKLKNALNPIYYSFIRMALCYGCARPSCYAICYNTNTNLKSKPKHTYSQNGFLVEVNEFKCGRYNSDYTVINYDIVENIKQILISIRFKAFHLHHDSWMCVCACKLCNALIKAINSLTWPLWMRANLIYRFILQ